MAAFKAANPGAAFEDFRRWYLLGNQLDSSGVDEMELDKVKIWEQVDACAASEQKPLFDYTREAEKVETESYTRHTYNYRILHKQ